MAIDTALLTDYSWSDIAKAAKQAMMTIAVGGTSMRMPDGRMIERMTIADAKALYDVAVANQAAEEDGGNGMALVQFGEPQ
jgi:hypothetical protein